MKTATTGCTRPYLASLYWCCCLLTALLIRPAGSDDYHRTDYDLRGAAGHANDDSHDENEPELTVVLIYFRTIRCVAAVFGGHAYAHGGSRRSPSRHVCHPTPRQTRTRADRNFGIHLDRNGGRPLMVS